jgi:nucleoside-diphosphate-sugar epimerase
MPLTVYQPGTQRRAFTHVLDIVDGLIRPRAGTAGEVYNLGNPANAMTITRASRSGRDIVNTRRPSRSSTRAICGDRPSARHPTSSRSRDKAIARARLAPRWDARREDVRSSADARVIPVLGIPSSTGRTCSAACLASIDVDWPARRHRQQWDGRAR